MSKREEIETKTISLLEPILSKRNFDLWDVEYVKEGKEFYLRAYIDKEGGITIDDCVEVSRELSDLLDEEDFIEGEYILEVSSPGIFRALKKDSELQRSIGKRVEIKLYKAMDKEKEFYGELKEFDSENIIILADEEIKFSRKDIAGVKLSPEI